MSAPAAISSAACTTVAGQFSAWVCCPRTKQQPGPFGEQVRPASRYPPQFGDCGVNVDGFL
jgi:hypothetical protein